ncbi:hypothetical protein BJX65DRAFT_307886 [Aspergillus insuetus]
MAYAFQLHKLHALNLDSAHILSTVAEIADNKMIPIVSLNIEMDEESIFATGRRIRRFVYHRRLYVAGDTASVWDPTVAPMCVGLCDHLPSLRFYLAQYPPTTWEILHIRDLPTVHEEYHPHNPTFDVAHDFGGPFNPPPTSLVNISPYRSKFTTRVDRILSLRQLGFWSEGPTETGALGAWTV